MLAWVGVGWSLVAAILFSGAAICLRGEREREEAINMQYLMPGNALGVHFILILMSIDISKHKIRFIFIWNNIVEIDFNTYSFLVDDIIFFVICYTFRYILFIEQGIILEYTFRELFLEFLGVLDPICSLILSYNLMS